LTVSCENVFNLSFSFNTAETREFNVVYHNELKLSADGSSFAWLSDEPGTDGQSGMKIEDQSAAAK
jgi:hypothetical protein